jgi:phosphodiesterase/alkaline phosphatase D-like protein
MRHFSFKLFFLILSISSNLSQENHYPKSKYDTFLRNRELHVSNESEIKIAIGSCHKTKRNNKIFSTIYDYNPDLYVWLGDAVYLDDSANFTCNYHQEYWLINNNS